MSRHEESLGATASHVAEEGIIVAGDEQRLTITLNRPSKANAMTEDMLVALRDAVLGARAKALVLTGAGPVFSGGADLAAAREGLATSPRWEEVTGALAAYPGLTIAALNGSCAGGALGMALACDLRIAVPGARLFYPVMKLGFKPQPSDPARLVRLVGPARAKLILMCGAKISAEEALAFGLVDIVTDAIGSRIPDLCQHLTAARSEHVHAVKRMIG